MPRSLPIDCAVLVVLTLAIPSPVVGETVIWPIDGTITLTDGTYEGWNNQDGFFPLVPCVEYEAGPVLVIHGAGNVGFTQNRGDVSGAFEDFGATIDGLPISGNLLPTDAYFRFGMQTFAGGFCECCQTVCSGYPWCRINWTIGDLSGTETMTTEGTYYTLPAREGAGSIPFSFEFCNHNKIVGAGCNVIDSAPYRWELHLPAPLRARTFASGDGPPQDFGSSTDPPDIGVTLDFASGPGGIVTATRAAEPTPVTPPSIEHIPAYWEINTLMEDGSYVVDLTLAYDPANVPGTINESELHIWRFNPADTEWVQLDSVVDTSANTVRSSSLSALGVLLLGHAPTILEVADLTVDTSFCIQPASGMAGWWPGNGDAVDFQGTSDGTLEGSIGFEPGRVGEGFSFAGSGVVSTPTVRSYADGTTLAMWARTNDDQGFDVIVTNGGSVASAESGMGVFMLDGRAGCGANHGVVGQTTFSLLGPSVADDRFHHLACSWTGDNAVDGVRLYVDGSPVATATAIASVTASSRGLDIGGHAQLGFGFTGVIDEIQAFDTVLTDADLLSIALAGGAGTCDAAVPDHVVELSWKEPIPEYAHDIVGGSVADLRTSGGTTAAVCLAAGISGVTWTDGAGDPSPGEAAYYLVRATTPCCVGTYGRSSAGVERQPIDDCPGGLP